MTAQKQGETSLDEVKKKVALEVELKPPSAPDVANQEAPILEKTEVPKTGDAPDDWDE